MSNKATFTKERTREEETAQVHEPLALAYQAHALAQALLAHYAGAQAWTGPPIGMNPFEAVPMPPAPRAAYGAGACCPPGACYAAPAHPLEVPGQTWGGPWPMAQGWASPWAQAGGGMPMMALPPWLMMMGPPKP